MPINEVEQGQKLQAKAEKVREISDVEVELVGSWLWVDGETYEHKDKLNELGFRWSNKREKWYWHTGPWKGYGSDKSYKHLKDKHGAQTIKAPEEEEDE